MAVSFPASATANADSLTMPTHQAGDLLVMICYRHDSNTAITPPSGWKLKSGGGGNTNYIAAYQKIAESSGETSGTWTNATQLICVVCRSDLDVFCLLGVHVNTGGTVNTVSWSGVTTNHLGNAEGATSRALYAAGCRGNATDIQVAPTSTTNVANIAGGSSGELVVHSLDTAASSVTSQSYVTTGTITAWRSISLEVYESFIPLGTGGTSGGGLMRHPGMSGGMNG